MWPLNAPLLTFAWTLQHSLNRRKIHIDREMSSFEPQAENGVLHHHHHHHQQQHTITRARHFQHPCYLQYTFIILKVTINISCIAVVSSLISVVVNSHSLSLALRYFLRTLFPFTVYLISKCNQFSQFFNHNTINIILVMFFFTFIQVLSILSFLCIP